MTGEEGFVRRLVPLRVAPILPGAKAHMRMFRMSDKQARVYTDVTRSLARVGSMSMAQADLMVLRSLSEMLHGKSPPLGAARAFHDLRLAFPILNRADTARLPAYGCPRGRVPGIVLPINVRAEDTGEEVMSLRRFDFAPHQADVFDQAIRETVKEGRSRDEAWEFWAKAVSRFIGGAEIKEDVENPAPILVRIAEAFAGIDGARALSLPLATEEDIMKLQFRLDEDAG